MTTTEDQTTVEDLDAEETTETTDTEDQYKDDGAEPEGNTEVVTEKKEAKKEVVEEDAFADDTEKINKQVNQALSPHIDRLQRQATASELKSIMLEHPEYKPYEARIKRFVEHPARRSLIAQGLPVNSVVIEAIAPYLQTIGAKRKSDADTKARQETVNANSQTVKETGKLDVAAMSLDDVSKMAQKIQSGQFKSK